MSLGFPKPVNGHNAVVAKPSKPVPVIPPYGPNSIVVENLTYSYNRTSAHSNPVDVEATAVLKNLQLVLPTGARCLLIGANGSGKSTLLKILAGRHMTPSNSIVKVLGCHAFHDTKLNFHRAYVDCDWGMRNVAFVGGNVPLAADIPVAKMMESLQQQYPERRDELIELLGVNLHWHMHQLSDGQRRRVQLFLNLLRPYQILLLDEVTTSLDVCVRQDLLRWLVKESDERRATIIYATHIFDGLDNWCTHLYYLNHHGQCGWQGPIEQLKLPDAEEAEDGSNEPVQKKRRTTMLEIAEYWLRAELNEKKQLHLFEKAQYAPSTDSNKELYDPKSQGGYGSGRLSGYRQPQPPEPTVRQGRLSDIMGNAGKLHQVHRVAGTTTTTTTSATEATKMEE